MTRFFGASNMQIAEDIVQETLISALTTWATQGIPDNPTGWLVQVAKRKALNELNRHSMMRKHHDSGALFADPVVEMDAIFLENEIADSQLRMIFTCCHASIGVESQIALTLKTLCGFGIKEVANALLTSESTINKRLYRAKEKIRESRLDFAIPRGQALTRNIDTVCLTLYLLFNEGYNSSSGDSVIRMELCLEAIRLAKLLADHFSGHCQVHALLSLMCFHAARFEARIDDHGAIVLFEDQDRSLWDRDLIQLGMVYMQQSIRGDRLTPYHIEARIAAEHCLSESFETTNWQSVYDQYLLLEKFKPNPVIKLNLAIIQSKLEGIEASLAMLSDLVESGALKGYHLLPATQGIFNMKLGNFDLAINFLQQALKLKPSSAESAFIQEKIKECQSQK